MHPAYETEWELEGEFEGEFESGFQGEFEGEWSGEFEYEGEEFLGRAFKTLRSRIGRYVKNATPLLNRLRKIAVPLVANAVGGPLGGILTQAATSALGEARDGELELGSHELEGEFEFPQHEFEAGMTEFELEGQQPEGQFESEFEGEFESEWEFTQSEALPSHEAMAEFMAGVAANAQTEAEAEAMVGASAIAMLSPADRAAIRAVVPSLIRGAAVLTRLLRRSPRTRPAVRVVPTIVRNTKRALTRCAASGQPVTRKTAARLMAAQTQRVLGTPRATAAAIQRNVVASRAARRPMAAPAGSR